MMIIEDEYRLKEEKSMMIGDNNLTVQENDLSKLTNNDLFKSGNRRKQVKPNRVTNDEDEPTGHQSLPNDNTHQPQDFVQKHAELNILSPLSLTVNNDNVNGSLSPSSPCLSSELPLPLVVNHQSSPPGNNKSIEKITEDYCEICEKRFCNKYYLRKHKGECHGIYTDYIKSLQKNANENPVKTSRSSPSNQISSNTLLLNPFYPGPSDIKSLFPIPSAMSIKPLTPPPPPPVKSSPQRSIRRCNSCKQEFSNKSLLRKHMNTNHSNEKSKTTLTSPANLGFLQPFVDTSSQLAHTLVTGQTSQTSQTSYGIIHNSYFSAKMADRVICEICNKQVCNKYFLKTHKAKVHGITNSEIQESNADNPDTYCLLCKKDFSTKYLYLFHMQVMHTDTSDSTLIQFMKENPNPFLTFANNEQLNAKQEDDDDDDDEADGNIDKLKLKRSLSHSSTDTNLAKRFNSSTETYSGLQPFLLESEDPIFSHTFVPCMVYLPVIRRVTKQVKINLRLKPVLDEISS